MLNKLNNVTEKTGATLPVVIVTIDGPAGAGKSSVARKLASRLCVRYLDTGAIYRAVAFTLDEAGIAPVECETVKDVLSKIQVELKSQNKTFVNGRDVSIEIRTPHTDSIVSNYSALPCVRAALLGMQREQAKFGSLVIEGRDAGSVVFPNASLKFYLTASAEVRAHRRCLQQEQRGEVPDYETVLAGIKERDRIDSSRETAPLTCPDGAIRVDSSDMTEDEVVNLLEKHVKCALACIEKRSE